MGNDMIEQTKLFHGEEVVKLVIQTAAVSNESDVTIDDGSCEGVFMLPKLK